MRTRRLLAALLLALPSASWGGAGTTPLEFLSLDADARAVALGGAYSALAGDANAMLYNPGGLAFIRRNEAVFMHNQYFEGVTQEYAALALRRGWGAQVNYLSYGDIPKTTIANKTGAGLSSFGITDLALSGGYGRPVLVSGLGAGAALKFVRETIETVSAEGLALDAGALYAVPAYPGLRLSGVVRNMGPQIRYQREGHNLPLELRLGAAYTAHPRGQETTLAIDVLKPRGNDAEAAMGLESVLAGRLPLRLGYDMRNDAGLGLSAGFGWRARDFRVDYAFVSFGELGSAHRVSAAILWGDGDEEAPRAAPVRREARAPLSPRAEKPAPTQPEPSNPVRSVMPDLPRHLWLQHHLTRAETALATGDTAAAESHLREAAPLLEQQPAGKVRHLLLRGKLELARKARAKAKSLFEEAAAEAERSGATGEDAAEAQSALARALLADGDKDRAEARFRRALEAHPSEAQMLSITDALRSLAPGSPVAVPEEY